MREPRDREALSASGRVLDQVPVSRPLSARICNEFTHAVELLVAREDQESPARPAAALVLFLDLVDELADQVEHAVTRPRVFPEIRSGKACLRGRHRRVARAAELPAVERQKSRLPTG